MPSNAIEVRDLYKRYKKADKNAIDGISFDVPQGCLFSLLGPNGAGKTTTISILTTTLEKTSGSVQVAGYDLDTDEHDIRRNIGVIFQGPSLDDNLTAEENIRLHAMLYGIFPFRPLYGLTSKIYRDRVHELADVLGITDVLFNPIRTLSGGMKRKLEIVRSLMHRPKVLFLDEPTTGLDPQSRRSLWAYLIDMRKRENMTILLTTHYLDEAEDADHIAIINDGKIVLEGTPRDIKQELVQDMLIVDAQDRTTLQSGLKKLGIDAGDEYPLKIPLSQHHRAQDIIRSIDLDFSVLDIERPTLEEAYLKIIET
jgi:ABC-2 type transport system ATP-binding protein